MRKLISTIFFVIFLKTHYALANNTKRLFSSKWILNTTYNFVVYDDIVIQQKKNDVLTEIEAEQRLIYIKEKRKEIAKRKAEERQKMSQEELDAAREAEAERKKRSIPIEAGKYHYKIPKNGRYVLENGFDFVCENGHIIKVLSEKKEYAFPDDEFFYDKESDVCKIKKFNFAYNYFLKKKTLLADIYQIELPKDYYPSFVRLIITTNSSITPASKDIREETKKNMETLINIPKNIPKNTGEVAKKIEEEIGINAPKIAEDLQKELAPKVAKVIEKYIPSYVFMEITPAKTELKGDLIAFFVSEKNEVGCMPYNKIRLYSKTESLLYPFFVESNVLIGKIKNKKDTIFIELNGPDVRKYQISMLDDDMFSKVRYYIKFYEKETNNIGINEDNVEADPY